MVDSGKVLIDSTQTKFTPHGTVPQVLLTFKNKVCTNHMTGKSFNVLECVLPEDFPIPSSLSVGERKDLSFEITYRPMGCPKCGWKPEEGVRFKAQSWFLRVHRPRKMGPRQFQ